MYILTKDTKNRLDLSERADPSGTALARTNRAGAIKEQTASV
jgi:hypothetical protein